MYRTINFGNGSSIVYGMNTMTYINQSKNSNEVSKSNDTSKPVPTLQYVNKPPRKEKDQNTRLLRTAIRGCLIANGIFGS